VSPSPPRRPLPFFLPLPLPFLSIGTLGAFMRIRSRITSKRELLDVGAAGPLAGMAVALPLLAIGIALSHFSSESLVSGTPYLAEPLLFRGLGRLILGPRPPETDLLAHPVALAAWCGLLFTMFNLLPFGQLDGGHILYALLGRWHRWLVLPLLAGLVALGFTYWPWWIWAGIAAILGLRHPWVPDEREPLDPRRRLIALLCVIVFVVCFTPAPIGVVE
jgi:membrane-associated protease RseP (regulator of RpoE activity)